MRRWHWILNLTESEEDIIAQNYKSHTDRNSSKLCSAKLESSLLLPYFQEFAIVGMILPARQRTWTTDYGG